MEVSEERLHEPFCSLAHNLINKMSVIVGFCDLLRQQAMQDAECAARLALIRANAESAVVDLVKHQCQMQTLLVVERNKSASALRCEEASKITAN